MGMTPNEFLSTFVEGNLADFAAQPESVRRGFNAAVAASHMADHLFAYARRRNDARFKRFSKLDAYVQHLFTAAGQPFMDVRSVANAYKHLYIKAHWSISSAGSIDCVEFPNATSGLQSVGQDLVSRPNATLSEPKVIFRRRDGTEGELLVAIRLLVDYWFTELYGKGA